MTCRDSDFAQHYASQVGCNQKWSVTLADCDGNPLTELQASYGRWSREENRNGTCQIQVISPRSLCDAASVKELATTIEIRDQTEQLNFAGPVTGWLGNDQLLTIFGMDWLGWSKLRFARERQFGSVDWATIVQTVLLDSVTPQVAARVCWDVCPSGVHGDLGIVKSEHKTAASVLNAAAGFVTVSMLGDTIRIRGLDDEQFAGSLEAKHFVGGLTIGATAVDLADVVILTAGSDVDAYQYPPDGTNPYTDCLLPSGACMPIEAFVTWNNPPTKPTVEQMAARARYEWSLRRPGIRLAALPGVTLTSAAPFSVPHLAVGSVINLKLDIACRKIDAPHRITSVVGEIGSQQAVIARAPGSGPLTVSPTSSTAERIQISTVPWNGNTSRF